MSKMSAVHQELYELSPDKIKEIERFLIDIKYSGDNSWSDEDIASKYFIDLNTLTMIRAKCEDDYTCSDIIREFWND